MGEYFKEIEEESIRDNFVIIYELLDELIDFGYPQTTESKILQEYITQEGHKLEVAPRPPPAVTNAVSWRSEGIKYRKNEVPSLLDLFALGSSSCESSSSLGKLWPLWLSLVVAGVSGRDRVGEHSGVGRRQRAALRDRRLHQNARLPVRNARTAARTQRQGGPISPLSLSLSFDTHHEVCSVDVVSLGRGWGRDERNHCDQVLFESTGRGKSKSVELEDVKFHQCVRLSRFENDRTISFIPPDGEFELMSYRLNTHVSTDDILAIFPYFLPIPCLVPGGFAPGEASDLDRVGDRAARPLARRVHDQGKSQPKTVSIESETNRIGGKLHSTSIERAARTEPTSCSKQRLKKRVFLAIRCDN